MARTSFVRRFDLVPSANERADRGERDNEALGVGVALKVDQFANLSGDDGPAGLRLAILVSGPSNATTTPKRLAHGVEGTRPVGPRLCHPGSPASLVRAWSGGGRSQCDDGEPPG